MPPTAHMKMRSSHQGQLELRTEFGLVLSIKYESLFTKFSEEKLLFVFNKEQIKLNSGSILTHKLLHTRCW